MGNFGKTLLKILDQRRQVAI